MNEKILAQQQANYDVAETCYHVIKNTMQRECMIASYDVQTGDFKFEEPDPTDGDKYVKYIAYKRCLQAILGTI